MPLDVKAAEEYWSQLGVKIGAEENMQSKEEYAREYLESMGGCSCYSCIQDTVNGMEEEEVKERTDHRDVLDQCRNAKDFRMELHRDKGSFEYEDDELIAAIFRNAVDLAVAIRNRNEREILNEAMDLSNWADIIAYTLAPLELAKIQDWVPVLNRINN